MIVEILKKNNFTKGIIYKLGKKRGEKLVKNIQFALEESNLILDLGAGTCNIYEILSKKGYKVTPLDIENLSFVTGTKPIIYDGEKIPFKDNFFDKTLILTVLHHTSNPENILIEAKRVSKEIIVMEDIYSNIFHKHITFLLDSLLNLEFIGHTHMNKSDKDWRTTFKQLGFKIVETRYSRSFIFLKHAIYHLKKLEPNPSHT